jgi:hypothetical protein
MVHMKLIALSIAAAASPVSASNHQPNPSTDALTMGAPAAPPEARYCLRVEPQTGSRIESVECWTREEWAEADVDVDKEWAKEGVRVIA